MTLSTVAHDTFAIERNYNAPVDQAFRAWGDPALKARWFAGSAEALGAGYELDFRVGGREVNRGGPPGGPVYSYESEFRDIIPEQRIIYTYEMYADRTRISVSVATVQFHSQDATTQLVPTEQGGVSRWSRHGGPERGGNPVPSGIAGLHLARRRWRAGPRSLLTPSPHRCPSRPSHASARALADCPTLQDADRLICSA